jgi:predicted metal-dependent hydrolase
LGYDGGVRNKSERIAIGIGHDSPAGLDPFYEGYFDRFNRGQFYEAHDVLEQLWLKDRQGPNGAFYKGLIQLAGAFVHLQKERLRPSTALFKLALANLGQYAGTHEHLALPAVMALIQHWLGLLEGGDFQSNPLHSEPAPALRLEQTQVRP